MSNNPASIPGATPNQKAPGAPLGISVEMVIDAYAKLDPPIPAAQLESILWLFRYTKANQLAGNAAVGRLFNPARDGSSISKLFHASYGSGLDNITADIDKLRTLLAQRLEVGGEPLVSLRITESIHDFAELVHATGSMGFLWGPTGSGKTVALDAHANRVRGRRVIKVDMPDGGAKVEFLDACLAAIGSSTRSHSDKKGAFTRHLNKSTELIIDEFHQTWVTGTLKVNTVEMIRRWHDQFGCSVLLCCTDTLEETLRDKRFVKILAQTAGRGPWRRRIPTKPLKEDIAAIAAAYRLTPLTAGSQADQIVETLCEEAGLRRLCKHLQASRILATNKQQVFSWEHVVATYQNIEAWAAGNHEEGN